jgi:hypothetical protein
MPPERRTRAADADLRAWHAQLLAALGYVAEPLLLDLESEKQVLPATLRSQSPRPALACGARGTLLPERRRAGRRAA